MLFCPVKVVPGETPSPNGLSPKLVAPSCPWNVCIASPFCKAAPTAAFANACGFCIALKISFLTPNVLIKIAIRIQLRQLN